jgi:hypothetical protein
MQMSGGIASFSAARTPTKGTSRGVARVISERASTHLRQGTPSGAAPRQTQQVAVARRRRNRSRRSWPRTPPAGCGPPCRGQPGSGDTLFDLLLALVDLARSEVLVARVHRLEFAAVANPSFVRFNSPTNASMTEQVVVREKSSRHSGIKVTCCRCCPSMNRGMSTPESAPSGPHRAQRVFTQPRAKAAVVSQDDWTLSQLRFTPCHAPCRAGAPGCARHRPASRCGRTRW